MFNCIPVDVSEIVVVYSRSDDIYVYREMKKIVEKFNDKRVEERIFDKLTRKSEDDFSIIYRLSDVICRFYDRPYMLAKKLYYGSFIYRWSKRCNTSSLPFIVDIDGNRYYKSRTIFREDMNNCVYKFGSLMIYKSGMRRFVYNFYDCNNDWNILA